MFKGLPVLSLLLLAGLVASCDAPSPDVDLIGGDVLLAADGDVLEARVPPNATLERLLRGHGVPPDITASLIASVREVFNPRHLRADRPYRIIRTMDGLFREFRYEIDADRFLRAVFRHADGDEGAFDVEVIEYPKELVPDAAEASISRERPSLVAALGEEGENVHLALKLADAFGGLIDFNSELQPGDRVRALFDRVLRNGEFAGYEDLRAAILENDNRRLTAIPFTLPDGKIGWYDEQGRSLKRQFLRSPLPFQPTISSGFSYRRLHPVTGNFAAHPAIDYRAAYGERVLAIAAGTVTFAATAGASGRMVRIRHAGGYESMYLHLSAFTVRAGQKVTQGQPIGRVGNSGVVTGTHLDFRLRKNGVYVNPLVEFRKLPPGEPIPAALLPAFQAERDRLLAELDERLARAVRPGSRPN